MLIQDIIPPKKETKQNSLAQKLRRMNKKASKKTLPVLLVVLLIVQIFLPVEIFLDPPRVEIQEARAEGEEWLDDRFRKRIQFEISNTGSPQTECPVLIEVNTQELIANEEMLEDGRDIRITADDGTTALPFSLLSGINTTTTKIGVRVSSIPVGTTYVYMYFNQNCESIPSASDARYWYYDSDVKDPNVTSEGANTKILLDTANPWGTEQFSATFNALNIDGFDIDIAVINYGGVGGYTHRARDMDH